MLEQAQQDPDGGIVVSMASRLDLHYPKWADRSSPADVQRWWAVTEDPSWNISSATITGPVAADIDARVLAALPDPGDQFTTATASDLGAPGYQGTRDHRRRASRSSRDHLLAG